MALDRERVIRTALALLDEVGLDALTLRKLAAQLGVQAPALYWHFHNKQELLDEMATTVFADMIGTMPTEEGGWQQWLRVFATGLRDGLLAHRDGARMAAGTYLTDDSLLVSMERPLNALVAAGFGLPDAVVAFSTVYSYVIGSTIEEQATLGDPRYRPESRRRRIDDERYPLTVAASEELFSDPDRRFASGLELIIAGLQRVGPTDPASG